MGSFHVLSCVQYKNLEAIAAVAPEASPFPGFQTTINDQCSGAGIPRTTPLGYRVSGWVGCQDVLLVESGAELGLVSGHSVVGPGQVSRWPLQGREKPGSANRQISSCTCSTMECRAWCLTSGPH